jgi:2-polyprenyl-3-methyl-5-hydroxy-6-metoxy-1,4-benzoquinol methylase
MPLFDGDNQAHWEAHYSWAVRGAPPSPDSLLPRWHAIVASGVVPADRVLVVGCGRGELVAAALGDGFPNVWGIDPSSLFGSVYERAQYQGVDVPVIQAAMDADASAVLQAETGSRKFDWVVTEDVFSCYDLEDPAVEVILSACVDAVRRRPNVIHIVSLPGSSWDLVAAPMATASRAQWATLNPEHDWRVW